MQALRCLAVSLFLVFINAEKLHYIKQGDPFNYCEFILNDTYLTDVRHNGETVVKLVGLKLVPGPIVPDAVKNGLNVTVEAANSSVCLLIPSITTWWHRMVLTVATNMPLGFPESKSFDFFIYAPPTIASKLSYDVQEGSSVNISCSGTGFPKLKMEIRSKIPSSPDFAVCKDCDSVSFPLANPLRNLSDAFQCVASIDYKNMSTTHPIKLNVQYRPKFMHSNILIPTDFGSKETIALTVDSNPRADLHCINSKISSRYEATLKEHDNHTSEYTATIYKVSSDDVGTYDCHARNRIGDAIVHVTLSVLPESVTIISPENEATYCDYYQLWWTVKSKPFVSSGYVAVYEVSDPSKKIAYFHTNLTEKTPGKLDAKNSWTRTIGEHITNLTANSIYKIVLQQVCNLRGCWNERKPNSPTAAIHIKTPPCNGKNVAPETVKRKSLNDEKFETSSSESIIQQCCLTLPLLSLTISWILWTI